MLGMRTCGVCRSCQSECREQRLDRMVELDLNKQTCMTLCLQNLKFSQSVCQSSICLSYLSVICWPVKCLLLLQVVYADQS